MGQVIWISGLAGAAVIALLIGAGGALSPAGEQYETAYAEPDIGAPVQLTLGSDGSALSAAAFGMSALQPETYNGEIVLDIIQASPLTDDDKVRLASNLRAAESGQRELASVLADVRFALAVE